MRNPLRRLFLFVSMAPLLAGGLNAQLAPRPFIRSSGEGSVSVTPDQVRLSVAVTTQAPTAQEASDQNATQTSAVLASLRQVLGQNGEVKSVGYSVTPNYRTPPGGVAMLVGYTVTNSFMVTMNNITMAGKVIDTATTAGANSVGGLAFTVKDPEPPREQALKLATQQARARADAIASGIGARVGAVRSVEESSAVRVLDTRLTAAPTAATQTPIEPGLVTVQASVTLEVEIAQ